jgi:chorismate mutase/prephenate dehydratase
MRIAELRKRIDSLDSRMVALLERRAALAAAIGTLKAQAREPVLEPQREREILENVKKTRRKALGDASLQSIYREIISACRSTEQRTSVAFYGETGSFSWQAARRFFGGSVSLAACRGIDEVFDAVQRGSADYGVVPVENSTEGSVGQTLDLLLESPLKTVGEVSMRIEQCLVANQGVELGDVARVYSHPQALAQCRRYLDKHLPKAERIAMADTATSAKFVNEHALVDAAAIASAAVAEMNGMNVLARGIQDSAENATRFLVLSRSSAQGNKTSIVFSLKHEAGTLAAGLQEFAKRGINLTRIESRPGKKTPWEYVFFVDFDGSAGDRHCADALAALAKRANFVKVLGSYPAA